MMGYRPASALFLTQVIVKVLAKKVILRFYEELNDFLPGVPKKSV